ncbi:MAG: sensor domain-containing diguanylate cyclase [Lachnospiraceae bacterium]|nr:sensor domain-containing diguanylate cyclase [Lachnospiraceae bacterium]
MTMDIEELKAKLQEQEIMLEDAEKQLQLLIDNIPGGILTYEEESGKFITISKGCLDIFGCDEGSFRDFYYNNFELFISKPDRQKVKDLIAQQLNFLGNAEVTFRVRDLLGETKYIAYRGKRFERHDGIKQVYAVIEDVTEQTEVQQQLQRIANTLYLETQRYQLLQEAVDDITFDYNVETDTLEYFMPTEGSLRKTIAQFEEKGKLSEYIESKDLVDISDMWKSLLSEQMKNIAECRIYISSRKKYVWSRIYVASFTDQQEKEKVVRIVGSIKDISAERKEIDALSKQANCDNMTGLYNKRAMQMLVKDYLRKHGDGTNHAMLMVDADNFKAVNDNLGHLYGDEVIKYVAKSIRSTFRESDFVGRVGGDEFLIFMKNADLDAAKMRAGKLNEKMRQTFENDGITIRISCSIGIALYPDQGTDYEALYQKADEALYKAKEGGRDRYELAGEEDQ